MRCREWEERIALWVGGDLGEETTGVERHLRECGACQAFAEEMTESLKMLRGAHAEAIPAPCFTAVRARVLDRLVRPRWKRAWAYAAAAIVLLLASGIGLRRPEKRVARVAPPVAVEHADVGQAVSPADRWQAKPPAPPKRRHRRRPAKTETILVKIETGNPDVVIYWIAEAKGDE